MDEVTQMLADIQALVDAIECDDHRAARADETPCGICRLLREVRARYGDRLR